jgi:hypothetical protein
MGSLYWPDPQNLYGPFNGNVAGASALRPRTRSSTLTNAQRTTITGIKLEDDFAGATIGKDIPVFIGGQILAGCKLAEGPFLTTVSDEGFVDFIVTPFAVAVPEATRELTSIRLNGVESFTSGDGGATWTSLGTVFDDMVINVLYGTETQTPFASSSSKYGARAVPYRSHVCIELQETPLTPFSNLIPFVSVQVNQDETLTRKEALERILRYARFDDTEFEVEVSGQDTFWVLIGQDNLFDVLQSLQMSVGRNWNIVATDKLRIFENSSTVTPIALSRDDVAAGSVRFGQDPPESVPAERTLGFVDTDADNNFNTVRARRARYPRPLTSSQNAQNLDIPIGMGRAQASTVVNKSLLIDEFAGDKFACKLLPHMRGIQPGDILDPSALDDEIVRPTVRVLSCAKNHDFTIDIIAERIELSLLSTGPSITSNGGGATASISIAENTTAVTTVTADQSGTFSISGGDDSSFFSIHPTTGVLTITARDFESPADADADNQYEVTVQITADGLTGTQAITVTITNAVEAGDVGTPMGLLLTLTYP